VKLFVLFFLLIAGCHCVFAQSEDFGLWIDTAVNKKIATSNNITLCNEFYTCNNSLSIDRVSIGLEADRNIFSFLNFGAGYLLMNKNKTDNYESRHRFYTNAKVSWKLSNLKFALRERLQITKYPEDVLKTSKYLNHWRNRMRITYNINSCKVKPVVGVETFVLLNRPATDRLDEVRYNLSVLYPLANSGELEFYGLLAKMKDLNQYIFGISYLISL